MPDRAKMYPVFAIHDTLCSYGLLPRPRATRIYKSPRFFFLRKRFCIFLNVWQRKAWSYKLHPGPGVAVTVVVGDQRVTVQ